MAGKKLPKDIDFAAGFFSNPGASDMVSEQIAAPPSTTSSEIREKAKHPGGRPKKEGLKNIQVSLTMHPEFYEKLRIVSDMYTMGNFSRLIEESAKSYCRENKINLSEITISDDILEMYKKRQQKKK